MQTQTHALIGAYFFGRRDATLMAAGAIAGMAPDLPMFAIVAALRTMGHSAREIFQHDYFQPWWQHINGIAHSLILWPVLLATALVARRQWPSARLPAILLAAGAGGFAHCCIDFLCHREDAHMQLWPISNWKFVSPISYYDPEHFGVPAMAFESAIGLFMAWRLLAFAQRRWLRCLIVLVALPYAATLALLSASIARAEGGVGNEVVPLGRFAMGTSGWSVRKIDSKVAPTRYTLTHKDGVTGIEAHADHSQALFIRDVDAMLERTPILCWRWRVAGVVERADIHKKGGDDQAARILVGLALPRSALSLGTRFKLALGRSRFGKLLPDGALNYVWDNRAPVGTIVPNAYTDRARMFVLQSGNAQAGKWVAERRDLVSDMRSQFGTTEGKIMLIALATDTDNTGGIADAAYADLHLVQRGAPCRF